jgi:hypothetical protein
MNKLAFTLATVAALGLSTAVFAQTSTTASTPKAAQPQAQATQQVKQSQTHATKHVKKRHHARHYASQKGKKVVTKHMPAKSVKTKAAS